MKIFEFVYNTGLETFYVFILASEKDEAWQLVYEKLEDMYREIEFDDIELIWSSNVATMKKGVFETVYVKHYE